MDDIELRHWIESITPDHNRLSLSVRGIVENLLKTEKIDYLAITSRVKDSESIVNKVKRKTYTNAKSQLTDISGIRIIVFFESDIERVCSIIKTAFEIDTKNSSNKNSSLKSNQTGYRSVHFVCELGKKRSELPENLGLDGFKFELQIRTVLQHAWAELAHDRNYKFTGKLPIDAERKLFLYAGMLELADRGLDELSRELDEYIVSSQAEVSAGDLESKIDSINLVKFMEDWSKTNNFPVEELGNKSQYTEVIAELSSFGISTLKELNAIIPKNYIEIANKHNYHSTINGVIRDWMLIHNWRHFAKAVKYDWGMSNEEIVAHFLPIEEIEEFNTAFPVESDEDDEDVELELDQV